MKHNALTIQVAADGFKASTCFLFLIFCSFFSVNSLPINPVYCFGVPLLLLSFFFINFKLDKLQFSFYLYFLSSSLLFFVGSYSFSKVSSEISLFSTFLYLYCILLGAQVVGVGSRTALSKRKEIYKYSFNFLIYFMILELVLRIFYAGKTGSFYDYKSSLFFTDSNFTSFIILFFLMFALFLKDKKIYDIGILKFLILISLLIMTFSRASIFAFFVSYLFVKSNGKYKTPVFLGFIVVYFYIFYRMVASYVAGDSYTDVDGSFNSKFYLISVAIDNYTKLPVINKFFGIGLNNFSYYSDGRFAHNIFITFIYEFGYLGFIGFILFVFYCYKKIGKDYTYLLIPMLVAGFSLFSAYMPFFFVLSACMYIEVKTRMNYISAEKI